MKIYEGELIQMKWIMSIGDLNTPFQYDLRTEQRED